jgi:hypothetical protein
MKGWGQQVWLDVYLGGKRRISRVGYRFLVAFDELDGESWMRSEI